MALLTVSINDQLHNRKSAEVAFAVSALHEVAKELQRGNGAVTSGPILGAPGAGLGPTSLGSWTYTPSATLP